MTQKYPSVYPAIDAAVSKYGIPAGGAPIALGSRLVADEQNAVSLPVICKKATITTEQMVALGAVTSGNIKAFTLPDSAVVFMTVLKASEALDGGRATGTITSDNTNVSDGDTVTIGSKVYTFKTALTPSEGQVLIGGSADASLLNLIRAINHSGTPGTDYQCAAANTQVTADTSVTAHAFTVHAIVTGSAGNSIATTETSAHLSWGGATLSGGATSISAATAQIQTSITNFGTAFDVLQAVGATVFDPMTTDAKVQSIGDTTDVNVHLALTGDNANTLTNGEIDVWVFYSALP